MSTNYVECCVAGCSSTSENKLDKTIKMHRFPVIKKMRKKWIKAMHGVDWYYSTYPWICSLHFESKCYSKRSGRLLPDAVPTLFAESSTSYWQRKKAQKRPTPQYDDDST